MTLWYFCELCDFEFTTIDYINNSLMIVPFNKHEAKLYILCDECLSFSQSYLHVTSNY